MPSASKRPFVFASLGWAGLAACWACGSSESPAARESGGSAGMAGSQSAQAGSAMVSIGGGGAGAGAGAASGAAGGVSTTGGAGGAGGSGEGKLEPWLPSFESRALSTKFVAEGSSIGDIDGDGALDVWAGSSWYAGPSFDEAHLVYAEQVFPIEQYSAHFLSFLDDLDGDKDLDGVVYGFPGEDARWYENPGKGVTAAWAVHPMLPTGVGNESPTYVDLLGDAKKELVFMSGGALGYAVRGASPTDLWTFKAISADLGFDRYTHGLGVGDVDGDGLQDVVERTGVWLQQPAAQGVAPEWQRHEVPFATGHGGAQMLIYDVDGDDDQDIVTSLDAHGYGLSWFEQTTSGAALSFTAHEILADQAEAGNFSQLHALALADLNGDGLPDFVTGKRYYAHPPPTDPGGLDPAVLYWFELSRTGGVKFTPHQIHADSGIGTCFEIGDLNGDQKPDLAITNKKGTFVHVQK